MPDVTVDRLALKLSGLSESEGRRLAALIAEGLAAAPLFFAPEDAPSRRVDTVNVNVPAVPGGNVEQIAATVVADVLRQLERTI